MEVVMQNEQGSFFELFKDRPLVFTYLWIFCSWNWKSIWWFLFEPMMASEKLKVYIKLGYAFDPVAPVLFTLIATITYPLAQYIPDYFRIIWSNIYENFKAKNIFIEKDYITLEKYDALDSKYRDILDVNSAVKEERRKLNVKLDETRSELDKTKSELSILKQRNDELQDINRTKEESVLNLTSNINKLTDLLKTKDIEKESLENNIKFSDNRLKEQQDKANELQNRVTDQQNLNIWLKDILRGNGMSSGSQVIELSDVLNSLKIFSEAEFNKIYKSTEQVNMDKFSKDAALLMSLGKYQIVEFKENLNYIKAEAKSDVFKSFISSYIFNAPDDTTSSVVLPNLLNLKNKEYKGLAAYKEGF